MGTTLEGKQINQTYQGLLKTTDNAEVSGTAKEITDGKGNGTGVTLDDAGNVTATSFTGDGSGLTNLPSGAVSSVNSQTGAVTLTTSNIAEGSNQYFTTVRAVNAVTGGNLDMGSYDITTTGKIYFANVFSTEGDLPSASTYHGMFAHVHATGKAYFAHAGAWRKLLDESSSNTDDLSEGSSNLYYTDARVSANSAVAANTAKTGITSGQASEITANTAKVGITSAQASDITTNNAKTGITTQQADDIVANNAKVTRRPITAGGNTLETTESLTLAAGSNVTITEADGTVTIASSGGASGTDLSNTPAGSTLEIESSSGTNTTIPAATIYLAGVMTGVDKTKLNSIEQNADVTDATNVTAGLVAATGISAGDKSAILTNIGAGSGSGAVDSVNGATGVVVLDTDDIAEGTTNLYYTDARADARVNLQTGSNLDLSSKSTSDLSEGTNLYYTEARVSANTSVAANTAKVGITTQQASDITTNNAKVGITTTQANEISANTLKVGITTQQASDISTNNAKVGITTQQAADIVTNNSKVSMVLGTAAGTALEGDTNTISSAQESAITANTAKISFDSTSSTKLGTIEASADVTDTANVTAAGALMDTEVDADIKTLALPANTTISTFAKTILDDADASAVRTTIGAGTGDITSVVAGTGLSGGATSGDATLNLANTSVTAGSYTATNITVDAQGRITAAANGSAGGLTVSVISGNTTAVKDYLYILTANLTLTLPASPSAGDSLKVSNLSGVATCIIARNGSNIMADASDMTLDNQYASFELIYGDATRGWVVVGGN